MQDVSQSSHTTDAAHAFRAVLCVWMQQPVYIPMQKKSLQERHCKVDNDSSQEIAKASTKQLRRMVHSMVGS